MKIIFTIVLLLFSVEILATEVGFFTNSHHYKSRGTLNENNPGLYLITDNNIHMGFFENSYNDTTTFIGGIVSTNNKYIDLKLGYGLMWGYGWSQNQIADAKVYGNRLLPYIAPMITIKLDNYRINSNFTINAFNLSYSFVF